MTRKLDMITKDGKGSVVLHYRQFLQKFIDRNSMNFVNEIFNFCFWTNLEMLATFHHYAVLQRKIVEGTITSLR